jgi:hypothetical protein
MKVVGLSALRTSHLYPQEIFLVPVSVTGWVHPRGHSEAGGIMSMGNTNDIIGNRIHDLPGSTAVLLHAALRVLRNNIQNLFKFQLQNPQSEF